MRRHSFVAVCVGLLLLTGACGREKAPRRASFEPPPGHGAAGTAAESAPLRVGGAVGGVVGGVPVAAPAPVEQPIPVPQQRKLIYQGEATLEVASVDAALARLRELTQNAGGYVTSEARSRDYQRVNNGRIECRVPSGKLDSVTAALTSVGTVESLTVSTSDV